MIGKEQDQAEHNVGKKITPGFICEHKGGETYMSSWDPRKPLTDEVHFWKKTVCSVDIQI